MNRCVKDTTYQRSRQHLGGPSGPRRIEQGRVFPIRPSNAEDTESLGESFNRSLRIDNELSVQSVHDKARGRIQHKLGELGTTVDSPPEQTNPKNFAKADRGQSQSSHISDAALGKSPLFPANKKHEFGEDNARKGRHCDDFQISLMEGKSNLAESGDYLGKFYAEKYGNSKCTEMLIRYVKDPTAKVYEYIWRKYVRFCQEKKLFMESGKSLVEFIASLDEEGFAASTIRTYTVAISSIAPEDPSTGKKIGQDSDVERCPVVTLKKYLHATKEMEGRKSSDALFLTLDGKNPLKAERISKMLRILMGALGINEKYRPHSTRATAPSTAILDSMPIPWILARANWKSASTLEKHYRKDLVNRDCEVTSTI